MVGKSKKPLFYLSSHKMAALLSCQPPPNRFQFDKSLQPHSAANRPWVSDPKTKRLNLMKGKFNLDTTLRLHIAK